MKIFELTKVEFKALLRGAYRFDKGIMDLLIFLLFSFSNLLILFIARVISNSEIIDIFIHSDKNLSSLIIILTLISFYKFKFIDLYSLKRYSIFPIGSRTLISFQIFKTLLSFFVVDSVVLSHFTLIWYRNLYHSLPFTETIIFYLNMGLLMVLHTLIVTFIKLRYKFIKKITLKLAFLGVFLFSLSIINYLSYRYNLNLITKEIIDKQYVFLVVLLLSLPLLNRLMFNLFKDILLSEDQSFFPKKRKRDKNIFSLLKINTLTFKTRIPYTQRKKEIKAERFEGVIPFLKFELLKQKRLGHGVIFFVISLIVFIPRGSDFKIFFMLPFSLGAITGSINLLRDLDLDNNYMDFLSTINIDRFRFFLSKYYIYLFTILFFYIVSSIVIINISEINILIPLFCVVYYLIFNHILVYFLHIVIPRKYKDFSYNSFSENNFSLFRGVIFGLSTFVPIVYLLIFVVDLDFVSSKIIVDSDIMKKHIFIWLVLSFFIILLFKKILVILIKYHKGKLYEIREKLSGS
ncbi:MAG: hypothetical protein CR982_02430 [Candidatus Cloacimonadota bacterium]|nr:MAG: hypothetical protein CR982_02430 [Candidatus Cloacimonadota bacterium]PIE78540.1 MAG: hypothetical protein CSA15_07550 [Candidatus Delongbacteria bacterium]